MENVNLKKDVLLDYTFVLDASGSMSREISEVLDELNRQLKELKLKFEETARPCRVTIVKFDTRYEVLRDQEAIEAVKNANSIDEFVSALNVVESFRNSYAKGSTLDKKFDSSAVLGILNWVIISLRNYQSHGSFKSQNQKRLLFQQVKSDYFEKCRFFLRKYDLPK